jgi:hypothetical protein
MIETWTKYSLREYSNSDLVVSKATWLKTIFLIEAYQYCKNKERSNSIIFYKGPDKPLLDKYDEVLNKMVLSGSINLSSTPGYKSSINTYIRINPNAKIPDQTPEEIVKVCKFLSMNSYSHTNTILQSMEIYRKCSMWQELDFKLLLNDLWIRKRYLRDNISEVIDFAAS